MIRLAAIDIGSNAIRLQVSRVIVFEGRATVKKLEYVRFPLRLGQDVFEVSKDNPGKRISQACCEKFMKLMQAFKLLLDLYEVEAYMGCATSAMREAENGAELVKQVRKKYGLALQVIDGDREAEILSNALLGFLEPDKTYLHIDVGGGSTELNLYVNKTKVMARSFPIGSVRRLNTRNPLDGVGDEVRKWIQANVKKEFGSVTAIGTGGNINKIFDLAGKKPNKMLALSKVISTRDFVAGHSLEDRVNKLQLNPDRADVIVPAADIYIRAMQWAKASKILIPDVGLKDGIMQMLYDKYVVGEAG